MMKVEIKEVKISEIKLNPDNPRRISKQDMDRLVKSLAEFPDMLSIREIVVDETMTVLGGNMRLLALKKSGAKECTAKIVTGLTPKQKREFIIKDNAAFGEWDMDLLSSSWSDLPLVEWGVDLPEHFFETPDEKSELTSEDVLEDNPKLQKFIEAREKSRERGKDKNELNFWVCLVFQSYDQKHEFLKQLPENLQVKYGMYVDGESLAEAVGLEVNPNQQKPFESRLDNTLKERAL